MPRLLISFCNQERSSNDGVLLYDTDAERGEWLRIAKTERSIVGSYGICVADKAVYVLYNVDRATTRLATLKRDSFAITRECALPEVVDPHSLALYDGALVVASTGTDQLLAYAIERGIVRGPATPIWEASRARADSQHLNSVVVHRGDLYVSAFGARASEFWRSAVNGYIFNVSKGRVEAHNVNHPHSLASLGSELYYLESSLQTARSLGGIRLSVPGYLRGCTVTDDGSILVASNGGRATSRSRGVVLSSGDPGNARQGVFGGACMLSILSIDGGEVLRSLNLGAYGREVYDVRVV